MAFKYPGCATCYFHDREPAICESCEDESEFSPDDEDGGSDTEDIGNFLEMAA